MIRYQTVKVISLLDFNRLVKETYGKPYHLQQQNGCMPRQSLNISVRAKEEDVADDDEKEYNYLGYEINNSIPLEINGYKRCVRFNVWLNTTPEDHKKETGWDDLEVELFWHRNFYPSLDTLLADLCKKELIAEGEYVIDIDW